MSSIPLTIYATFYDFPCETFRLPYLCVANITPSQQVNHRNIIPQYVQYSRIEIEFNP